MNIDFAPSPLATSPDEDGIRFEFELLPHRANNYLLAATTATANGQVTDMPTDLSTAMADVLDENGPRSLHHAARMNDTKTIDFILKAGALADVYTKDGLTPLHVAAR